MRRKIRRLLIKVKGMVNVTSIIAVLSLVIGIVLFCVKQYINCEYIYDWMTTVANTGFSIFLTLTLVQIAIDNHSKRVNLKNEKSVIIKNYISISMYFKNYASYYNQLVIPFGNNDRLKNDTLENDFVFSDMKYLFEISSDSRDPFNISAVESFLKYEFMMREKLNDLLMSSSFEYHKRLAQLINDFILVSIENDTRDGIIDVARDPDERIKIKKLITDEKVDWVNLGVEGKINCCNMYFFYRLYLLLKKEAIILGGIMEIINVIHDDIIGVHIHRDFIKSNLEQPYRHCTYCETYSEEKIDRCPNCGNKMI